MNHTADHGIRFERIAAMLPVKDIVKAHDFHAKAFSFTKTFQNGDPVGFMILERDEAELHLTLGCQPDSESNEDNTARAINPFARS
jgi:hypothetical protein